MSGVLLAEFPGAEALLKAARRARETGYDALDAFAPFAVEGLAETLGVRASHVRVAMFIGGVGAAALAYGTEFYTAAIDYPVNSGGRPLNAWPAFMLFPFAIGIFAAAVSGLITLLVESGLPRLHHALFAVPGFERASQDAFLLAIAAPAGEAEVKRARDFLQEGGATAIWEVET
jgi:Alternative complex III, ActD subunit